MLNPDGTENTSAVFIGNINPIRYRSYYYDVETGLYYLQTRYYDPQTGRFISMDSIDYLDPETIGGANLFAYCRNNPVMRVDPSGTFDWGTFFDVLITAISGVVSFIVGTVVATKTALKTLLTVTASTGRPDLGILASLASFVTVGITTTTAVFGFINNAVNLIYYNFVSDGVSNIAEPDNTEDPSYYVINGYINRWERLDYTKSVMMKSGLSENYNLNAWRYYSEYGAHMYAWTISSWAHKNKNAGIFARIASASYNTGILVDAMDENDITKFLTIMFGILGL